MNDQELMSFAIARSNDPIIKNPVLRDAMNKDLGPRTNFDDGGKVNEVLKHYKKYLGMRKGKQRYKVIPFTKFFEEFARENFADGGVTLITQGKNKGKYHLRLGSGKNRKTHIGTKDKLDLIFKNRRTSGGDVMSRLDKVKNPKGYLTQSQFQTFLKENNINAESSGSSFAKNHGVNTKVNPLQKNTLLYDTGQFTEEFIETVQKAQVKSGVGTKFARDKFPPKTKSDLNKIRQAEIEAQGGIKKNSPFAGKKKLKVDLGHTGDYKTELVTGDKLAYTPSRVNAEMGKKGNLDDKIRAVKKKQNKALETLEGDDLKKILNETDATLTRLADQSSGFKSVVLSNGKKYGGDRLTIDPFNVYPGKTEVEIRDIQNKYSKKKIITEKMVKKNPKLKLTSPAEIQKIQDAYFFEANRKSSLKAASKIGKKDQTKMIEKLNFHPDTKKKLIKIGCGMYAGGRVGLKNGSGACITKALKKMDNPKGLSAVESRLAKEVISESKKLTKAGSWIKGDLYFGAADMLNNWSKGQGFLRGLNNATAEATLGAIDVNADETALSNLIQEQGSEEDKEAFEGYLDAAKKFNTYQDAEKGLTESEEVASLAKNLGPKDGVFFPVETEGAINANKRSLAERRKQAEEAGNNPLLDKGYNTMNEYMERLAAQDFNKTAGTLLDRGYREMIGVKGDEGLVWGPTFGTPLREANFKKFRPQDIMNYHPVYGYKEDLKKEMRRGNSPMEDILYSMDEYGPSDKLQLEAENDPMGTYDYDQRYAKGGLANLMKKYYD